MSTQPTGDCYHQAYEWASHNDGEVVHAQVTHPKTLKRIGHAWAEKDGLVYDTTIEVLGMPTERYYALSSARVEARYSVLDATLLSLRTGNWGPWTAAERAGDK